MTAPAATSPAPLHTSLIAVSAGAVAELDPIWTLPAPDLINALYAVLPPLVDKWTLASSSAAATWYDQLRDANTVKGRFQAIVKPLVNPGSDALAGWGSQPLSAARVEAAKAAVEHPPVNLDEPHGAQALAKPPAVPTEADLVDTARYHVEGGLQKRIVNAANLTVTDSANQDPQARGWMRKTRPGACNFCIMVASRGGVFTKASSTFACHENCYCTAVPAWGGQELPVGPYKPSDKPSTAADRARVRRWIKDNLEQ